MWLFVLFFIVPVIEIVLFIKVGSVIGIIPTVFVILITALAGTFFVKQQASQLFDLFKRKAGNLEDPSEPIGHGVLVLFAGALLLTPGFFTDVFGFLLLVPNFRYWIFRKIEKKFIHMRSYSKETPKEHETIYDADFTDITPNGGSPWNKNKNQKD